MMKHTKEEILKALIVIKEECKYQSGCDHCPFGDEKGKCIVYSNIPENWNIAGEAEIWRALL